MTFMVRLEIKTLQCVTHYTSSTAPRQATLHILFVTNCCCRHLPLATVQTLHLNCICCMRIKRVECHHLVSRSDTNIN